MKQHRLLFVILFPILALIAVLVRSATAVPVNLHLSDRVTVSAVDFLGQSFIPPATQFEGTEIGGLSGIAYDAARDEYYVVSDDRGGRGASRFYSVEIELSGDTLTPNGVTFRDVTPLLDAAGQPFPVGSVDPEAIVYAGGDSLFVASEGPAARPPSPSPFVYAFGLNGRQMAAMEIPDKFLPDGPSRGVRDNLAFESLTLRPDGRYLFTATENALRQDGPAAAVGQPTLLRIIAFDTLTGQAAHEWAYEADPVPVPPNPPGSTQLAGLAELLALDNNGTFLALERAYAQGTGFGVKLYLARAQGALAVESLDGFDPAGGEAAQPNAPLRKELLVDLSEFGLLVDNVEGMALGPVLSDGRQSLILVSDNNFNSFLFSRFIALALTFDTIPAVQSAFESSHFLDEPPAGGAAYGGVASGVAIWPHPDDPELGLVLGAAAAGGLQVMDMDGDVLQTLRPGGYGQVRYDDVAVVYRVPLGGSKVDLVVAYNRGDDTLAVWRINPADRRLEEVTSPGMPAGILDADGNEAGLLAAYQSPVTGKPFVFVGQQGSNRVAQLELVADGSGKVTARPSRNLTLPAAVAGIAADRMLGTLYAAAANDPRIFKYGAEPNADSSYQAIDPPGGGDTPPLSYAALTIYYGVGDNGYLLAAAAEDQSIAIFHRGGRNEYIGRLIIGDGEGIDQVNWPAGIDVVNVPSGPEFPAGLLVVADAVDDPQNMVVADSVAFNNRSNFKLLGWDSVAAIWPDSVIIDTTTFNPRFPHRALMPVVIGPSSELE